MHKLKIKKGPAIKLDLGQEIALTNIIGAIIIDSDYRCVAYNICKDHVHMILVCTTENLPKQIQKIKSVSSKLIKPFLKKRNSPMEHIPLNLNGTHMKSGKTYTPFWSQKFFHADLDVWTLGSFSNKPGYIYADNYLSKALIYIRHNREKHGLPDSIELKAVIDGFLTDMDTAFRDEE